MCLFVHFVDIIQNRKMYQNYNSVRKGKKLFRFFLIFDCVLAVILCVIFGTFVLNNKKQGEDSEKTNNKNYLDYGTDNKINSAEEAVENAKQLGKEYGYKNALAEMTVKDAADIDGDHYYRLQQNYRGIPVYVRTIVYVTDEENNVISITGNVLDVDENTELISDIGPNQAAASIESYLKQETDLDDTNDFEMEQLDEENLCIYSFAADGMAHVAYQIVAGCYEFIIDAQSGEVLHTNELLQAETGYSASDIEQKNGFYVERNDDGLYQLQNSVLKLSVFDLNGKSGKREKSRQNSIPAVSEDLIFGNDKGEEEYEDAVHLYMNLSQIIEYFNSLFKFDCRWLNGLHCLLTG